MDINKGFYSLVQFCPDRGRAEAVNIGVALFVPELQFLDVRSVESTGRIARVFGKGRVDRWWLSTARKSFVHGLKAEFRAGRLKTAGDLDKYLSTLGNDIVPTQARPTSVGNPEEALALLFERLVEDCHDEVDASLPPVVRPIEEVFDRLSARFVNVGRSRSYGLTGYPHNIQADYVYWNGKANLIRLLKIRDSAAKAIDQAVKLGGESEIVERHLQVDGRPAKLVVVAAPMLNSQAKVETESAFANLRMDFRAADWIESREIPSLAARIERDAH